jgi:RNA polymerase sigma factor (sigma-70 family)
MSTGRLDSAFRHLRHYLATERAGATPDGELLRRFTEDHDESAFAALVQRYGPLVLGACRRVLAREQDAEDAFQATFLVLVRRAAALDRRGSLANWLYTVAYHAALKTRAAAARRPAESLPLDTLPAPDAPDDLDRAELRAVLDEELRGLPARYREPLLLCDLQGRTHVEAARALGRPAGSMSRLLERARSLLRDRLARRGLALSTGLLATLLAQNARAVTPALAYTTLRAVAAGPIPAHVLSLVEGVLRQMFLTRVKVAAAVLLTLGLLGVGAGLLTAQAGPKDQPAPTSGEAPAKPQQPAADEPGYEAPLPAGALARLGTARFRHSFSLRAVAISPDGKLIASGSGKGTIRLWETDTGREVRAMAGHTSTISGLAFSPDGKTLASASWDRTTRLWDVASGNALGTLGGHETGVQSVAFSPDGKKLLTTSSDRAALVWDHLPVSKEPLQLQGHDAELCCGVFSHDGKLIATGSVDKTARLWDAQTGKELRKFEGHNNRVRGVAFSPDDKRLITGGWDSTPRLWEVSTGKMLFKIPQTSGIEGVAFAPGGKAVATASGWDDMVRVYDLTDDGGKLRWSAAIGQPFAIVFSKDGKKVAASGWDSRVRVFDAATGQETAASRGTGHTGWVNGVSFLDRKTLLSSSNDGTLILWDVGHGKERQRLHTTAKRSWCLAVTADGKTFATGGHDETVTLWDAATVKVVGTVKVAGAVRGVALSPDGKRLVAASDESLSDGSIKPVPGNGAAVYETATGKVVFRLEGHEGGVRAVAWSPDGKYIGTGGADKTARLWDAANGKELRTMEGAAMTIETVLFSPDSRVMVWGAQGGTTRLLRVGSEDGPVALPANGAVTALAFSPDGRTLATATRGVGQVNSAIRLWDVATAKERARFPGHQQSAASLAFSPDGRVLASGGTEGTVLLWDVTGRVENGKFVVADLPPPSLEGDWTDLTGEDGFKIHRAVWTLAAAPKQALPLLRETLKPVQAGDAKRIEQLIKDLDHDDFDVREKASAELERVGEPTAVALRKALEGTPSAEMRVRITRLLDKFGGKVASPDVLRRERALEVLEQVGGAEARALLEDLAKGAPEAALTQEAKAALKRLEK